MEKKRGVLLVFLTVLVLFATNVMAADSEVNLDIIVGVIVVAILIIIVVVLLMLVLKKRAKKPADLPPAPRFDRELYMTGDSIASPEAMNNETPIKTGVPAAKETPKEPAAGGFLAKARSLQQNGQTTKPAAEDQYKVGGFKKEEVEQILSVPENTTGPMKACKGCGFELAADEKVCPVCGKKQ